MFADNKTVFATPLIHPFLYNIIYSPLNTIAMISLTIYQQF